MRDDSTNIHSQENQGAVPWDLLAFYLADECTPEERKTVESWIAASPGCEPYIQQFRKSWENPENPSRPQRDLAAFEQSVVSSAEARMKTSGSFGGNREHQVRVIRSRRSYQLGALAGCCLLMAAGLIQLPNIIGNRLAPAASTYSTTNGQRANITLADGSYVILAPGTTIRVSGRSMELSGEAVFKVIQHAGDPFTILSSGIRTTVLGTEFAVRAYDSNVRVAVRDGKVSAASVILSAGEVATGANGTMQIQRSADVASMFAFSTGHLLLDNIALKDAVPDLNRWYDADIHFGDNLIASRSIQARLPQGSITDLSQYLTIAFNARVERKGKTLTLFAR